MKAISVLQPWAALLVCGAKRIETRTWQTRHRGPLLIHAGLRANDARRLFAVEPFASALRAHGYRWAGDLPRGVLLGTVELVDCIPVEMLDGKLDSRERALGDYRPGGWAWLLERPTRLPQPISLRGALGIFDVHLVPTSREEEP